MATLQTTPRTIPKMTVSNKSQRGFTLIEMLVYIALFSVIMSGAIAAAFGLLQSTDGIDAKVLRDEETNFLLKKIDWALSGTTTLVTSVASPTPGSPYSQTLRVTKANQTQNPVEIRFDAANKRVEMRRGPSGPYIPITSENVEVTSLGFRYVTGVGGAPDGIIATTTIEGVVATTTNFVRK